MTSLTSAAFVLARCNTSFNTIAPRSDAGTFDNVPLKLPVKKKQVEIYGFINGN